MLREPARVLLLALLLMLSPYAQVALTPSSSQPATRPRARTDRYGDTLPTGAVARLGTRRLRHPGLYTVTFATDGKHLATSNGRTVFLWQRAQGRLLWQRPVEPSGGSYPPLAFSPDAKLLAVGSPRGVQVWRTATAGPVRHLGTTAIAELAFDPSGRKLIGAQAAYGRTLECIRHWDLASGRETACVKIDPRGEWTLSPDGRLVVLWERTRGGVYDTQSGAKVRPLQGDFFPKSKLRFTPNGKLLYGERPTTKDPYEKGLLDDGRPKDTIQCWEVASGRALRPVGGRYERWHSGVAVSPDGKLVAYGGQTDKGECILGLRERASGTRRHILYRAMGGTPLGFEFNDMVFAPDGRVVAGWENLGIVRLWDVASGKPVWTDEENYQPVLRMQFTPDGRCLLTQAEYEYAVRQWDASSGKEVRQFRLNREESLESFGLSPDGRTLALGCKLKGHKGDEVRLLDMASARELRRFPMPYDLRQDPPGSTNTERTYWSIYDMAFRDNRILCVGFANSRVAFWDISMGRLTRCDPETSGRFTRLSADGRVAWWEDTVHIRELKTQREWTFPPEKYSLRRAWFSSERWLLLRLQCEQRMLELMDLRTGQVRPLHGRPQKLENPLLSPESDAIGPAALTPDGQSIAYMDYAGDLIRLFDVRSGRVRGCFHSDQGAVRALLFSPDGKRLASAGQNATVLIWDVASAQPLPEVRRSEREIEALWQKLAEKKTADAKDKTEAAKKSKEAADAMWQLTESPRQVLPWLRRHLRPAPAPDTSRLSLLLRQLDSNDFQTRQRAYKEIQGLGEAAEDALKQTLASKPSLEVRRRVQELLRRLAAHRPTHQRELRAVEALEHIGSREARTLLKELAGGRADAPLTRAARAALERIDKESTSPGAK